MRIRFVLALSLLGVAVHASIAMAQTPGTFTPAPNMIKPRSGHTATLLYDGRVLIAGGEDEANSGASAELYDPATGTFTATGPMTVARGGHTATLLPSGKVLMAGGGTNSAELYDPATGTFTATGPMTVARSGHAVLLNTGKVLIVAGGAWQYANAAASADLYDPATGTFTATGSMHEPSCESATLLPNGKVLITREYTTYYVRHAELYDPSTGTFAFTGDTVYYHNSPTATLLPSGKVLIAGGDLGVGDGNSDQAELYDPVTGTFAATSPMTQARENHAATLLPDGTALLTGGHYVWYGASAEIYDTANAAFDYIPGMPTAREWHTATLLNDGRALIAGGQDFTVSWAGLSTADFYTPAVLIRAPALFSLLGDGRGQGAIWHAQTGQIASAQNPAAAGEVLAMYTTSLADGGVVPPQVAIGGPLGEVLFFGTAPGYPGYYQVNFRVPNGVAPGSAVSVRLTYIGRPSNAVTIGVQ
jgi:hypothetical protein